MANQASRETVAHSHATAVSASGLEFAETSSVTLEWRLSGLKDIYSSTKGETKSRCIRSATFGDVDNLWEILFYPNSGNGGGEFASLYLSCIPTDREKDQAIGNRWVRKGLWWFRLEVKTVPDPSSGKSVTIATKDASDHNFAVDTANWGWQSFARRDHLFTAQPLCIVHDALIITCTIQAQPQPPAGYWLGVNCDLPPYASTEPSGGGLSSWAGGHGASGGVAGGSTAAAERMTVVPKELVNAVAGLINDERYSDVEFILPAPVYSDDSESEEAVIPSNRPSRRVLASRTILERLSYFDMMFSWEDDDDDKPTSEVPERYYELCDSDQEEERRKPWSKKKTTSPSAPPFETLSHPVDGFPASSSTTSLPDKYQTPHSHMQGTTGDSISPSEDEGAAGLEVEAGGSDSSARGIRKPREPSSRVNALTSSTQRGPRKRKIVITDAALSTWYAIIYWTYTDRIVFAPLSSSFNSAPITLPQAKGKPTSSGNKTAGVSTPSKAVEYKTRKDWIDAWLKEREEVQMDAGSSPDNDYSYRPNGLVPVSAKAVYRLADKMDIEPLKLRAYQHIMAELTVENVPFELFSRFSSVYSSIRKVQMAFFLKNWGEIRKSQALAQIWTQIRLGRHVGFEEVWPLIVGQLEFKPAV